MCDYVIIIYVVTCTLERKSKIELFHPAIKCLIEANPSALLWKDDRSRTITCEIACHSSNYVLMPWIATNHQWVLNDEGILINPPVYCLIDQYASRGATGCSAAIIQQFFEAYPRGLTRTNEYGFTPLHAILSGSTGCEPALFKWLTEQCPNNMSETDNNERTPLHCACYLLTHHLAYDSSEICKYLIAECPQSVRELERWGRLPIHYLLEHCQHRTVKGVVVCLLQSYPESYDMAPEFTAVTSSIPFVQHIKPLLDEESEIKENAAYFQQVSETFFDAVDGTKNPRQLASSTCHAFGNWAKSFTRDLEAKLEQIVNQLQDQCNEE